MGEFTEIFILNPSIPVGFSGKNRDGKDKEFLVEDDRTLRTWSVQVLRRSSGGNPEVVALGETNGRPTVMLYGADAAGNHDQIRTNANEELIVEHRDALLGRTGRVLGTSDPAAATNTNLYTPAASTTAMVTTFTAANRSASAVTIRVGIDVGGNGTNTPSADQWLYYDLSVPANTTLVLDAAQGLWLATLDDLVVYAASQNIAFIATGVEYA